MATLLVGLLLVPPAYASPPYSGGGGTTISGGLICESGICILVPYIPPFPTLSAGTPYQLTATPYPTFPTPSDTCNLDFLNPLTWGNIFDCIGKYVTALIAWLPSYIEAVVADAFIGVFNAISRDGSSALDEVWNAAIGALNVPIGLFDGFTVTFGAVLLGGVLSIGEPWSLLLVPVIWGIVVVIFVALVVGMLWGAKELISAVKAAGAAAA